MSNNNKKGNLFQNWIGAARQAPSSQSKLESIALFAGMVLLSILLTCGARIHNYNQFAVGETSFMPNSYGDQCIMFILYALINVAAMGYAWFNATKNKNNKESSMLLGASVAAVGVAGLAVLVLFFAFDLMTINVAAQEYHMGAMAHFALLKNYFSQYGWLYLVPAAFAAFSFGLFGINRNRLPKTSGVYGQAKFSDKRDLKTMGAYNETGTIFGKDKDGKYLRYPLGNRTIISQPKGGKTAGAIIPALLTENRQCFVHDVKGELWAVTARQRHEQFGHEIVTLDPFRVTKKSEFTKDKSHELTNKFYCFNPFDFIPEDQSGRDRAITSIAHSIVVQGDYLNTDSVHFRECAVMLIEALIEWVVVKKPVKNLVEVRALLLQYKDDFKTLLQDLLDSGLEKCRDAASVILNVGSDEYGSVFSTTIRQLSWLGNSDLKELVSTTNFDFNDFLQNKMDIYVIMPEDQVKPQSRVVRMILSCIRNRLVQLTPSQMPDTYSLFIFDEQGQLGYCSIIEEMIEVLRAKGVVVWSVFQTFSQIMEYKKADLFIGSEMVQTFRVADDEGMKKITYLGGTRTVSTTSTSKNKNGGKNGNSSSISEQEHSANLINTDMISTLPFDEQLVFIHGQSPIHCEKLYYINEPFLQGTFDRNPVENLYK